MIFLVLWFSQDLRDMGPDPLVRIWQTVNCISESMYMFCDGIFNFRYFSNVNLQQNQEGKVSNQI